MSTYGDEQRPGSLTIECYEPDGQLVILISVGINKNAQIGHITAYMNDQFESEEYDNEWPRYCLEHYEHCCPPDISIFQIEVPHDWHLSFEELEHIRNMAIMLSEQVEE